MFGIRESFPTLCDACASLAKVLCCLCIQAQLGRICSLALLPAWPADDKGLPGTDHRLKREENGHLKEKRKTRTAPQKRKKKNYNINQEVAKESV